MRNHVQDPARLPGVTDGLKPLAVSIKRSGQILGVGNTKMWELINAGAVKTISIGRRRLVVFESLETLVSSLATPCRPTDFKRK